MRPTITISNNKDNNIGVGGRVSGSSGVYQALCKRLVLVIRHQPIAVQPLAVAVVALAVVVVRAQVARQRLPLLVQLVHTLARARPPWVMPWRPKHLSTPAPQAVLVAMRVLLLSDDTSSPWAPPQQQQRQQQRLRQRASTLPRAPRPLTAMAVSQQPVTPPRRAPFSH